MMRIAHLSDLHFGAHRPALVAPLLDDIARFAPDAIAISGDLTQRAREEEFLAAAGFIAALPAPVVTVPGNHDIPGRAVLERMLDPRRRWRQAISATTEPVVTLPGLALIGLDTVRRAQPHLDWSAGGISAARLARLSARITAAAGRCIVVVAHHPLRHPAAALGRARPLGAQAALAMMGRAGVSAILSGHLHRAAMPAGTPPVIICGSSLSDRVRDEPNAWVLVELGDGPPRVRLRLADGTRWRDAETA